MTVIQIWPEGAPGSEEWTHVEAAFVDEFSGDERIRNVVFPTLTVFPADPSVATGMAVVIAPGGGFFMLSWDSEGTTVAEWLAAQGIAAFVLKYRLEDTGPTTEDFRQTSAVITRSVLMDADGGIRQIQDPGELGAVVPLAMTDGQQALRVVRARASEWSVDPGRIGLLGFSAGAFVAAAGAVSPDGQARPNFVGLIYGGSIAGPIPPDAPPMFCVVAADDPICLDTTLKVAEAWRRAGRPVDLHLFAKGGHGFGATKLGLPIDAWPDLFLEWVRAL
jgi:acetyl esterase/lipase